MLVLTRRSNEDIVIPEYGITIKVLNIQSGKVRIGIDAPREVGVVRGELAPHEPAAPAHSTRALQYA